MKLYYVFHTHPEGHDVSVFSTEIKAKKYARQLASEYAEEYGAKRVTLAKIPDLTDGSCNIELKHCHLDDEVK